jgi:hypothetical protein
VLQAVGFLIVEYADWYHGPSPVYFEYMLWPMMFIFTAVIVSATCWHILSALRSRLNWSKKHSDLLVSYGLLFIVVLALATRNAVAGERPPVCVIYFSIRPTPITERLRTNIAIQPGVQFRGMVATFDGAQGKTSVTWWDLYPYDLMLWQATGNDHRAVGLWWYKIPTLFQYTSFITPPYYLLLTDFLARREDRQARSVLVLTRPDERMLKLWGVRYVITDTDLGIGRLEIEIDGHQHERLRLVELDGTNLGDYSPTELRRVENFREGLRVMHEPSFDGQRTVVINEDVAGPLVPAQGAKLVYQKPGFSVQAASMGRSVLVLPVQYSRCWTVSGKGDPVLIRANMMQLGISFQGELDANLVFRFGPIRASRCREEDIRDMERLRIRDARVPASAAGVAERH